jgi:hypothetical protein
LIFRAHFGNGQIGGAVVSRSGCGPFKAEIGVRFSSSLPKAMSTQTIELEGFEIELAEELYCDRGGDHGELADRARTDRRRLGHNIDESAVLCVRCMKAIPLKE